MLQLANKQTDPVTAAAELIKKTELIEILNPVQVMISRIIRLKMADRDDSVVKKDNEKVLIDIGKRLNFKQLYTFLDDLSVSKQLAGGPLDDTLALESGLISWQRMFS